MQQMLPMLMMTGNSKMDPMMMFMMMNQMGNNNAQNALPNSIRNNPFKRS
jgi:hypothetical protein